MRLCARTQRVSVDTRADSEKTRVVAAFNHLYHKQFAARRMTRTVRFDEPPPEPLADALGFLLSWNGQRMRAAFGQALEPLGLRPPHFGVLRTIAAQPGTTQNDLVARSMIDPSTMVKLIDELEARGLAERRVDAQDRRRRAVHLTHEGQETLERARAAANRTVDEMLAPLSQAERDTLRSLLRK